MLKSKKIMNIQTHMNNNITEDYCLFEVERALIKLGCNLDIETTIPHSLAIKQIFINYNIYPKVNRYFDKFFVDGWGTYRTPLLNTPQDAIENWLLYTLKNLI